MSLEVHVRVVGLFQENSYLLVCGRTREAVFVDPGDEAPRLVQLVEEQRATPRAIYLTHAHIDHVGAAAALQARYGIPVYAPPGDLEWLEALPLQAQMFRLPSPQAPRVDGQLTDGQEVRFGDVAGRAIATPGHTEGGTCLYFPEDRVLVTGDTLFVGSVGRTDLPGGDWDTLERSIQERLFALPDDVTFYPGHGGPGRLGEEKRENPFVGAAAGGPVRVPRMP